jgi:hypothetical protein
MSSHGVTRRTILTGAGALAAAGAAPRAAAAAAVRVLGPAAEVIGEIAPDDNGLTGYGYVTHIAGLADSALFAGATSEAGARLTFFSTATVTARFPHGALVSTVGRGAIAFHLSGGGADFANPQSFAAGPVVARFDARLQNIASVVAPNQAVTTIEGELVQRSASGFRLGSRHYRLGRVGSRVLLSATGPGMRTNQTPPRALFDVAGRLHR